MPLNRHPFTPRPMAITSPSEAPQSRCAPAAAAASPPPPPCPLLPSVLSGVCHGRRLPRPLPAPRGLNVATCTLNPMRTHELSDRLTEEALFTAKVGRLNGLDRREVGYNAIRQCAFAGAAFEDVPLGWLLRGRLKARCHALDRERHWVCGQLSAGHSSNTLDTGGSRFARLRIDGPHGDHRAAPMASRNVSAACAMRQEYFSPYPCPKREQFDFVQLEGVFVVPPDDQTECCGIAPPVCAAEYSEHYMRLLHMVEDAYASSLTDFAENRLKVLEAKFQIYKHINAAGDNSSTFYDCWKV